MLLRYVHELYQELMQMCTVFVDTVIIISPRNNKYLKAASTFI